MSVLFHALERVAQEEQKKEVSLPQAEIVTLFAPKPKSFFRRGLVTFCVLALALGGGLFWARSATPFVTQAVAAPAQNTVAQTDSAPAAPAKTATGPVRPAHKKTIQADPDGIALPVEALKEMSATDPGLAAAAKADKGKKPMTKKERRAAAAAAKAEKKARIKAAKAQKAEAQATQAKPEKTKNTKEQKRVVATEDQGAAPDLALDEAHDLLESGKYRAALQRYDEILSKNPDNRAALEGKVYALQQFPVTEAEGALAKVTKAHGDFAPAFAGLARTQTRRDADDAALASWRQAVALDPSNNLYRLSLAILCDRLGQGSAALEAYRGLSQPWPKQVEDRVAYLAERAEKEQKSGAAPDPQ
jgi:tetratricopeptide (TPR) repeat protein